MSRLPLSERLQKPMRQPREVAHWSLVKGEYRNSDEALRYYYFPDDQLDRGLNLATGFNKFSPQDAQKPDTHLDPLLRTLIEHEEKHGRIDAHIITWRGILTNILSLVHDTNNDYEFNVCNFDDQIFIEIDHAFDSQKKAKDVFPDMDKFMYAGFNFEKFTTLEKTWGESTRDEIEGRYKGTYEPGSEYGVLLRSGIGSIKVAYGAEVDCVEGDKNPEHPLAHYVELKTTAAVVSLRAAEKFEQKLFRSWLQSFLAGIPKVIYGFRSHNFDLVAVEEFKTTAIPALVKNSQVTPPHRRWNGNDAIGFYAVFLAWLRDSVKPGETYRLRYRKGSKHLELLKEDVKFADREHAFLLPEFVEWRRSQK